MFEHGGFWVKHYYGSNSTIVIYTKNYNDMAYNLKTGWHPTDYHAEIGYTDEWDPATKDEILAMLHIDDFVNDPDEMYEKFYGKSN